MKKNYERIVLLLLSALLSVGFLAGCNDADNGDDGYLLKKEDISVNQPDGGFKALAFGPAARSHPSGRYCSAPYNHAPTSFQRPAASY